MGSFLAVAVGGRRMSTHLAMRAHRRLRVTRSGAVRVARREVPAPRKVALAIAVATALVLVAVPLASQSGQISLSVLPSVGLPLGADSALYSVGGGGTVAAELRPGAARLLMAGIEAGYSFVPLEVTTSLSLICGGARAGLSWDVMQWLTIYANAGGGGFFGFLNDGSGTRGAGSYLRGAAGVAFAIAPSFAVAIDCSYRRFLGLYSELSAGLGLSLRSGSAAARPATERREPARQPPQLGGAKGGLQIVKVSLQSVYPIFYKHYDASPLGTAVIRNDGAAAADGVKVSLWVKEYMTNPKTVSLASPVPPGGEVSVDLFGLFTNKLLEISEGTLVSANIALEYTLGGEQRKAEYVESVRVMDRNALTWDDDRKAAAFVTAKDPTVLRLAKNVAGAAKGARVAAVNQNLLTALAIHEALRLYGLAYIIDPSSPYGERSASETAVDFLQFPQQTLEYKAGDCDDLSILYCALLESVGVPTAFITVPGHIYMAVGLGMRPDVARRTFLRPDDLVYDGDETWLPLEVTKRDGGFLDAWELGAKEWRENAARQQAALLQNHASWQLYEPVGFSGSALQIALPAEDRVLRAFTDEVVRFVDREIYPQVSKLQADIRREQSPPKLVNQLGVLYARYGLYDRAAVEFRKNLEREEHVPSLLNLGNIAHLTGDLKTALAYYDRAYKAAPEKPTVLVAVASINHEIENYGLVRELYAKLKTLDGNLAQQYAYLDLRGEEARRASQLAELQGVVTWDE